MGIANNVTKDIGSSKQILMDLIVELGVNSHVRVVHRLHAVDVRKDL